MTFLSKLKVLSNKRMRRSQRRPCYPGVYLVVGLVFGLAMIITGVSTDLVVFLFVGIILCILNLIVVVAIPLNLSLCVPILLNFDS